MTAILHTLQIGGHAGHDLPSFISKAYADKVLDKARHRHDQKKAEKIRDELASAWMTLEI